LVLIWYVVGKSVNNIRKGESSMNQKLKQAGLFAILAVFTISMTTSFVGDAEATAEKGKRSSLPIAEPVEPSIKAQQKANAEVETKPEAPRSESNQKRPAGETPEPSIKAQQRAQASSFDPVNKGAPVWETPEPSIKAQQRAQALDQ